MEFIVLNVSLISFVLFGKKLRVEWSTPIYLSGTFWMIYTLVSYIFMRDSYSFSMIGIVWINIACWVMLFCENFGDKKTKNLIGISSGTSYLSNQSWLYLKLCCVLGFIAFLYQISLYGFRLSSFTSLDTLATMNNTVAVARYSGNGIVNGVTQILLIFVYAAPACGGFALVYAKTYSQKVWCILALFPGVLMVLFTNTKAVVIGVAILWISSYLIAYFCRYKHAPIIKMKVVLIISGVFVLFFCFLFFSMTLRMGEISPRTLAMAQRKLSTYAFGGVQSFDWWCANAYDANYKFGTLTYLGISDMLGLAQKAQGVYTSYVGTASNVFTVFRGIIEDFGFFLGILYLSIKAMLCGVCLSKIRKSNRIQVIPIVFLVAEMFFLVYGFIISTWTYMSYILALVVFGSYLLIAISRNIQVKFGRKKLL